MRVIDAIRELENLDPSKEIVIAYWDRDQFEHLSDESWEHLIFKNDAGKIDWSVTWDILELTATADTMGGDL